MLDDPQWQSVVDEALRRALEGREEPIPGARLRGFVNRVAAEQGLSYPPTAGLKFGEFLSKFPERVRIVTRAHQDILVVPAGRADLLAKTAEQGNGEPQLRRDIFAALTRVDPDQVAWYDLSTDRIQFRLASAPSGESELKFPRPSMESEIALRSRFADGIGDDGLRRTLRESLTTARPLAEFSRVVHSARLKDEWRAFRQSDLLSRLQSWATESNVPWRDSWLVTGPQVGTRLTPDLTSHPDSSRQKFAALLLSLDERDLARLLIPADLVLRLLDKR